MMHSGKQFCYTEYFIFWTCNIILEILWKILFFMSGMVPSEAFIVPIISKNKKKNPELIVASVQKCN